MLECKFKKKLQAGLEEYTLNTMYTVQCTLFTVNGT